MLQTFTFGKLSYRRRKRNARLTVVEGTKAPQAAGKIHSDFEKGFIRAEIVPYETMLEMGGYNQAKEKEKSAARAKIT